MVPCTYYHTGTLDSRDVQLDERCSQCIAIVSLSPINFLNPPLDKVVCSFEMCRLHLPDTCLDFRSITDIMGELDNSSHTSSTGLRKASNALMCFFRSLVCVRKGATTGRCHHGYFINAAAVAMADVEYPIHAAFSSRCQ